LEIAAELIAVTFTLSRLAPAIRPAQAGTTAPWGLIGGKQTEEKGTPSGQKISPTDSAHFAMLSRGNCLLSVEGIPNPIPLAGGDCILLARGTSFVLRDSLRTRPKSSFREIASKDNSNVAHYGGGGAPNDNRLWVLEFRSRQPEADHSVIAELHSY
jgi:hypothetical protein